MNDFGLVLWFLILVSTLLPYHTWFILLGENYINWAEFDRYETERHTKCAEVKTTISWYRTPHIFTPPELTLLCWHLHVQPTTRTRVMINKKIKKRSRFRCTIVNILFTFFCLLLFNVFFKTDKCISCSISCQRCFTHGLRF